jgi:hypothetical protein
MATCDDREEWSLGLEVEARRAAGGRGGMSRIGKIGNGLFLVLPIRTWSKKSLLSTKNSSS